MDAASWDERYRSTELLWGAEPNRFVAAELASLSPGLALDVACGEGRNAIWLASLGWRAVGVDFSTAGLARAATLAEKAGVSDLVEWVAADVVVDPLPPGPFDAVIVAYLQLPEGPRRTVARKAAQVLAPGGVLVIVGHDRTNLTEGVGGPPDPQVLFSPGDLEADLDGLAGIVVEKAERLRRPVSTADGEREAIDALLRARRTVG
jgi:SAM-dependent methyltransferase